MNASFSKSCHLQVLVHESQPKQAFQRGQGSRALPAMYVMKQ